MGEPEPSGYTVSIHYEHGGYDQNSYSLDDGNTWNLIGTTGYGNISLENVSQIKFKTALYGSEAKMYSSKLSLNISGNNVVSNNFILSENISDVNSYNGGIE